MSAPGAVERWLQRAPMWVLASAAAGGALWSVGHRTGRPGLGAAGLQAVLRARPAYRWTCEVSVYLELDRRRTGGGRALCAALLERLAERGLRTAVATVALPNEASAGLHRALGFEPVGVLRRAEFEHGARRDVAWWQRELAGGDDPPAEPR